MNFSNFCMKGKGMRNANLSLTLRCKAKGRQNSLFAVEDPISCSCFWTWIILFATKPSKQTLSQPFKIANAQNASISVLNPLQLQRKKNLCYDSSGKSKKIIAILMAHIGKKKLVRLPMLWQQFRSWIDFSTRTLYIFFPWATGKAGSYVVKSHLCPKGCYLSWYWL